MKTAVNTLGLILATVGSFLVWHFIGELNFADKKAFLEGKGVLTVPDATPSEIAELKRKMALSKLGMAGIAIGGVLQIVSNFMP